MNKTTIGIIVVVILIGLGGWYYYAHQGAQTPAGTDTDMNGDMGDTSTASSTLPAGEMETGTVSGSVTTSTGPEDDIAVSGFNFGFTPSTITVKKGDHVKITFTNSGGMHDFVIDEFNVKTPRINTGETAVVEFDATKAGTFQFYCSVGNHRAMGMFGSITVTE